MEPKAFARTKSRKGRRRKRQPAAERAAWIVATTLVLYAILVAPHGGEFWPFSIYPQFSRAAPWSSAIVRELPTEAAVLETLRAEWPREQRTIYSNALPGVALPLANYGLTHRDLEPYTLQSESWTPERLAELATLFERRDLGNRELIVFRVQGLHRGRATGVTLTPVAFVAAGGATPLFLGDPNSGPEGTE